MRIARVVTFDKTFGRLAAEWLDYDLPESNIVDGAGDKGIDFWFQSDSGFDVFQVKTHDSSVSDISRMVRATNTQNPMQPRNLLSNNSEQVLFEKLFAELGWFYERKQRSNIAFERIRNMFSAKCSLACRCYLWSSFGSFCSVHCQRMRIAAAASF